VDYGSSSYCHDPLGSRLLIVSRFIQESGSGDTRTYPATAIIV